MLSLKVKYAILILGELESAKADRSGLKASELKIRLGFPPGIQHLLVTLKIKGLLGQDAYRGWYYVQADLHTLSLWELITLVEPYESYWGSWPTASVSYPGAVRFNSSLEEYVKRKTADISIFDLLFPDKAAHNL